MTAGRIMGLETSFPPTGRGKETQRKNKSSARGSRFFVVNVNFCPLVFLGHPST
jgi:hypothetical protein